MDLDRGTTLVNNQVILLTTPAAATSTELTAAQTKYQSKTYQNELVNKIPTLINSIRTSEDNWRKAREENRGEWRNN